jgi:hypothetical protein
VDRAGDIDRWAAEVYGSADEAAVTQVTDGRASSSLSCQAVVADMLDSLVVSVVSAKVGDTAGVVWRLLAL